MEVSNIKVSITTPVYNHEKYIEKAINSVLMQKVNFEYELLIGEDCSTDNSLELIKKYEGRKEVKIFAREKNMNQEKIKNSMDLALRASGEYIIGLEGDDYWTDPYKLQKQVDFLDAHPEYIACAHHFQVVDADEIPYYDADFECQFFQDNEYNKQVFEKGYMLSHGNTLMYRNIYKEFGEDMKLFTDFRYTGGDYLLTAWLVLHGKMYCLPETMSCYRKVTKATSSSFSARMERNNERDKQYVSIVEAERFLNRKYEIDFGARKKSAYASAVFKWYRERTKGNWNVVTKIIKYSGQPFIYSVWLIYLLSARTFKNIIGKGKERVRF